MDLSTRARLSLMMFLQYFVWGAWFVPFATYLSRNGLQDSVGTIYSAQGWAAIAAPLFVGALLLLAWCSWHVARVALLGDMSAFEVACRAEQIDASPVVASPVTRGRGIGDAQSFRWAVVRVRDGLLYMQVTRGVSRRDHAFPSLGTPPSLVVTVRRSAPYPADADRWAGRAVTHPDERWARCDIKSVSLLPNVLARQAAREGGAIEAVLIDAHGMVTEGAATTVWIVDGQGVLRTRHLDHQVLPGCTRDALTALLDAEGIGFEERGFSVEDLRGAREPFLTSATSFVRPVTVLDGAAVGDGTVGPVTRRLFALFARHVQGGPANEA